MPKADRETLDLISQREKMDFTLRKLDSNAIAATQGEIRAFACIRNEVLRLPFLLDYHRALGVDRFFFIDNLSNDGTTELLLGEPDCHVFECEGNFFRDNVEPPRWTNALRRVYGDGFWCLSLDADEMFVYPRCEDYSLGRFCEYLERTEANALTALVIDCYGDNAILQAEYRPGQSFLAACPYFDPELGYEVDANGEFPQTLMFSKFRERAFWQTKHRRQRPPCITQVPLVKWSKSTEYLVAQHSLNQARLSNLQGGILHFKFLPGFYDSIVSSISENAQVAEKGLAERATYVDALKDNPDLNLRHGQSVRYRDAAQLVELGWLKTSAEFEDMPAVANPSFRTIAA